MISFYLSRTTYFLDIYTFKVKKKTGKFLGRFSPCEISKSGDKMSSVIPEFPKLIMELITFQYIYIYFINCLTKIVHCPNMERKFKVPDLEKIKMEKSKEVKTLGPEVWAL